MKIVRAHVRAHVDPVTAQNAVTQWTQRQRLILILQDAEGRTGHGEAAPLPGYSPESLEQAAALLPNAPFEVEADREGILSALAQIPESVPSARFAMETALLDLWAQASGMTVLQRLGGQPAAMKVAGLVTQLDPESASAEAQGWMAEGASALKVKVGRPGQLERELAMLSAVQSVLPGAIPLRLDANRALPPTELTSVLTRFLDATARLEMFEEPVHPEVMMASSSRPPIPWALDETLQPGPDQAWGLRLDRDDGVVAWVLKPAVIGGVLAGLRWWERAQPRGIEVVVSHMFDGPIGFAANQVLAQLVGDRRAHGLGRKKQADQPSSA